MKKLIYTILFLLINISFTYSQTLIESYPFPNYSQYNSFWGITKLNDTLRIGTDNNGSIYKVTTNGILRDSLSTSLTFTPSEFSLYNLAPAVLKSSATQ